MIKGERFCKYISCKKQTSVLFPLKQEREEKCTFCNMGELVEGHIETKHCGEEIKKRKMTMDILTTRVA